LEKHWQEGGSSVADAIEHLWKHEQQTLSEQFDQTASIELENSSFEFNFMLSRLVLPRLIDEFQNMVGGVGGKSFQLQAPSVNTYQQIMKYCQSYGKPHEDVLSVLCTLGDFVGRIEHSAAADQKQLMKIKEREEKEFNRISKLRHSRDSKLSFLKGEDEDKFVFAVHEGLGEDLQATNKELAAAIYEEEEARKAYERAVAKTKAVKDKLAKLESVVTMIENQRSMLITVNENRCNIDSIFENVYKNRIEVVASLQSVLNNIWLKNLKNAVYSSALSIFQQLWTQFQAPKRVDTFNLRIGKEILTLWRKQVSKQSILYPVINQSFEELSRISTKKDMLLLSEDSDSTQSGEDFSSATVVLYNTLNYHETPSDHVESQARTRTAINTILQRFQDQRKDSLAYNNSPSPPRLLALKECNDVTSVPLYCLPLVHSPQYLRRLYDFSKEAEEEDLYVPLEFDTEWETELEYSDSDSDHGLGQELFTGRLSRWSKLRRIDESSLRAILEDRLPNDKIQLLATLINPTRQEYRWASLLSKTPDEQLEIAPRQSNQNLAVDKNDASNRRTVSPGRKYSVGRRVKTSYGDGVIIDDNPSRPEAIYTVQLHWGAKAFVNDACILLAYRKPRKGTSASSAPSTPSAPSSTTVNRVSVVKAPRASTGKPTNVASIPEASSHNAKSVRFKSTDMRLHRLVCRILEIVKLNRFVVENAGLRDANFSLWLHGRASGGLCNATEVTLRKWLIRYDPYKLNELLTRYESSNGKDFSLNQFAADLEVIDNTNPNTDGELLIIGCSDDPEVLRKEASEFSHSKLATKAGGARAFGQRKRRSRKSLGSNGDEDNDDDGAADDRSDDPTPKKKRRRKVKQEVADAHSSDEDEIGEKNDAGANHATEETSTIKRRRRGKRLHPIHNPLIRSDLPPTPTNLYATDEERQYHEDVRFVFARLMQLLRVTQTDVVQDFARRYNFHSGQANISAWLRHKMAVETMYKFADIVLQWVSVFSSRLLPEDQELLQQLLQRQPTMGHRARWNSIRKSSTEGAVGPGQSAPTATAATIAVVPPVIKSESNGANESTHNVSSSNSAPHALLSRFGATLLQQPAPVPVASETEPVLATNAHASGIDMEIDESDDDSESSSEVSASSVGEMENDLNHHESNASEVLHKKEMKVLDIEQSSSSGDDEDRIYDNEDHSNDADLVEQDEQEADEGNESDNDGDVDNADVDDGGVPIFTNKMIRDLLTEFVGETDRRMLSHLYVDAEAKGVGLSLPQPAVSKFVRTKGSPYANAKKDEFCYDAMKWVNHSKTLPPPYLKDAAGHNVVKDMFCSACNRLSSTFASKRVFYDHMGACAAAPKLGNKAVKVTFRATEDDDDDDDEEEEYEDVEDGSEVRRESSRKPRPRSFVDLSQYQMSPGEIRDAEDRLAKDLMDVQIYPFNHTLKYSLCSRCGEAGSGSSATSPSSLIPCRTCPSQCHLRCMRGEDRDAQGQISDDDWCCPTCEESGIADSIELAEDAKRFALTPSTEIFCFFPQYRSWKNGVFLAMHSKQANLCLVRFLHYDLHADNSEDVEDEAIQWINLDLSVIRMAVNDSSDANGSPQRRLGQMNHNGVGSRRGRRQSHGADLASNIYSRPYLQRQRVRTTFFHDTHTNSPHQQQHRMGSGRSRVDRPVGHASPLSASKHGRRRKSFEELSNVDTDASELKKSPHTPGRRGRSAVVKTENHSSESKRPVSSANKVVAQDDISDGMTDTYISATTMKAALASAGIACKAVDVVLQNADANAFACIRPPGHHAGRHGCTRGCLSTGFCILNNAAIALVYSRVRYGLTRVAVVDFDVHFGNGTADILQGDPNAFFASVHMVYGPNNDGQTAEQNPAAASAKGKSRPDAAGTAMGFYPAQLGRTEITDNYVCIGVQPENVSKLLQQRAKSLHSWHARRKAEKAQEREDMMMMAISSDDDADPLNNATAARAIVVKKEAGASSSAVDIESDGSDLQSMSDEESTSMDVDESMQDVSEPSQQQLSATVDSKKPLGAMPTEFVGSQGFLDALQYAIIPKLEAFAPELLIISAGFDGYRTDPIGGALHLSLDDYSACTSMLMNAMKRVSVATNDPQRETRVISLLEGGYDTSPATLGLAKCVERHVMTLRSKTTN
jgi:acetoin utilization deacetylase AcuC-like enzyme